MADEHSNQQTDPYADTTRRSESPSARDSSRRMDIDGPISAPSNGNGNGDRYDGRRDGGERRERAGDDGRGRGGDNHVENVGTNLHVSGLALRVEPRDLEDLFGKYGQVDKASVMYDPHTRDSRGFGFVMMTSKEAADACIANLDKKEFQGKIMVVALAKRGRARTPTPGRYHGPPKPGDAPYGGGRFGGGGGGDYRGGGGGGGERQYQPRSYDSRYAPAPRYDDRERGYGGGRDGRDGRDDRGGRDGRDGRGHYDEPRRYDDRRDRYDDHRPAAPRGDPRDSYGGGRSGGYDDRRGGAPPAIGGGGGGGYDRPPRDAGRGGYPRE